MGNCSWLCMNSANFQRPMEVLFQQHGGSCELDFRCTLTALQLLYLPLIDRELTTLATNSPWSRVLRRRFCLSRRPSCRNVSFSPRRSRIGLATAPPYWMPSGAHRTVGKDKFFFFFSSSSSSGFCGVCQQLHWCSTATNWTAVWDRSPIPAHTRKVKNKLEKASFLSVVVSQHLLLVSCRVTWRLK